MILPDPPSETTSSSLPRREPPARRRRRRRGRLHIPQDAEGRDALLGSLSHRAHPTYELFVFAGLAGAMLALGYILDSQALLLFGVLVAPIMLPWVGLLLATVTGSIRFFFETLMALIVASMLVLGIGVLAGFAARALLPHNFEQAFVHSRLWWPDLIILALSAVILTVSFIRSEAKPFLPSVVLAYEFFLPLCAGGFGLGSGVADLWPHGLLVFAVHFAWAAVFGLLTLLALRIAPPTAPAVVFTAAVAFVLVSVLVLLMSPGGSTSKVLPGNIISRFFPGSVPSVVQGPPVNIPVSSTVESAAPTPSSTFTPVSPTLQPTDLPTETATVTLTVEPTPIYAQVSAPRGGAVLRETPGGDGITTLDNFTFVELLPETEVFSSYTWVHVVAVLNGERRDGWMVQQYLQTATPDQLTPVNSTVVP